MKTQHTPEATTKIMIVDDHPIFRKGLVDLIVEAANLHVCAETGEATEAMRLLAEHEPDFMTIDISLTNGSGLELIKQIRAVNDKVKLLVCSMHDEKFYAQRAMRAGADGYLTKDKAASTIVEAIRHILAGKVYLSPEMTERLVQRRLAGKGDASDDPGDLLSDRELEIFDMIGDGVSTQRIAERLQISHKTVETHREHIKQKLDAVDNTELVRRAVAWRLQAEGEVV